MQQGEPVIVCGLGYGNEGKGTIVDALTRHLMAKIVFRYNGGPQAAHSVVTPEGIWHSFSQFGSGSFLPGVRTALTENMLLDLETMAVEAQVLQEKGVQDIWSRLIVDPDCLIITPMQKITGRMREIVRGDAAHGSCGMGIGETVLDGEDGMVLRVRDILDEKSGKNILRRIAETKLEQAAQLQSLKRTSELDAAFAHLVDRSDPEALFENYRLKLERFRVASTADVLQSVSHEQILFEGAQGALLDRRRGFVPHVTKSDTTSANAVHLLTDILPDRRPFTLGVLRAYGHRHGAGPFVTEDESLRSRFDDTSNPTNRWQGRFRVGWLDLPAVCYGLRMNGRVDALAITGLDRLSGLESIRICTAYRSSDGKRLTDLPDDLTQSGELTKLVAGCRPEWISWPGWSEDIQDVRRIEDLPSNARALLRFIESAEGLRTPIGIVSVGPTAEHKIFCL